MTLRDRQLERLLVELAGDPRPGASAGPSDLVERALASTDLPEELRQVLETKEGADRLHRMGIQIETLRSMDRQVAPSALDRRLERTLLVDTDGQSTDQAAGIRAASSLGLLEPLSAPPELDGMVVAAMNAGYRQERVTRRIQEELPRVQGPRLEHGLFLHSEDSPNSINSDEQAANPGVSPPRGWLRLVAGMAAAAALIVVAKPFYEGSDGTGEGDERLAQLSSLSFTVERVESLADLTDFEIAMVDNFTGGVASLTLHLENTNGGEEGR